MEEKIQKDEKEEIEEKDCCCTKTSKSCKCGSGSNCIYGLGFVGAAVFFISQSTSFWTGVLAILKAIVWPAFMVYDLLKFLQIFK